MDDIELTELLNELPENPGAMDYRRVALNLIPYVEANVPPMGENQTANRLRFLTAVARHDLGLARLMEGHVDASQILKEANAPIASGKLYAVWAAGGPSDTTAIEEPDTGKEAIRITGSKPFCTGSDLVDRALVYVYPQDQLVDVDLRAPEPPEALSFQAGQWISPAFAETHTWTVRFDEVRIPSARCIGAKRWYFDRPGFCLGAFAPAACWAGGAMGLVDEVRRRPLRNGHARAHLGAMVAAVCSMDSILTWGAEQIDADPGNSSGTMFPTALVVRHLIERTCTEILDRFGRTLGPRPFAFEPNTARRIAELTLYIRQCHAECDLEELGAYVEKNPAFGSARP